MNKEGLILSTRNFDWKKTEDYVDRFSEVMIVSTSERSVILDFGLMDEKGKKAGDKGLHPINPFISHHTRLRVSPEHFVTIVEVCKDLLEKQSMTQSKEKVK